MRPIACLLVAGLCLLGSTVSTSVAGAGEVPAIYLARAEAVGIQDGVNFPPYVEGFAFYSASEASNESSHSVSAPWYPGFILRAGMEEGGAKPVGTAESRFPQGPTEADGGAPLAASSGKSDRNAASGSTRAVSHDPVGFGEAASTVRAEAQSVVAEARVALSDVALGNGAFVARQVVARASAVARKEGGPAVADGSVELIGSTVGGVPVAVTPTGVTLADTRQEPGGLEKAETALKAAGVDIRRLPNRQEAKSDGSGILFQLGGIEVTIAQGESRMTHVLGRVTVEASGRWAIPSTLEPVPADPTGAEAKSPVASPADLSRPSPALALPALAPRPDLSQSPGANEALSRAPVAAAEPSSVQPERDGGLDTERHVALAGAQPQRPLSGDLRPPGPMSRASWTLLSGLLFGAFFGVLGSRRLFELWSAQ